MASPLVFSYTLLDTNNVKASVAYYYTPTAPTTITLAQVVADWHTLGGLIDAASNARILSGRIQVPEPADSGWKTTPVEENDLSDVIIINYNNAVTRYPWAGEIPNLKNSEITAGRVDLIQADVLALTALVAGGGANGAFTNTAGQDLTGVRDGFQADRKHRRQLYARSLAVEE